MLFTGDHLAWSRARCELTAFRSACWFDWDEQVRSMDRLAAVPFEWVLPGHGDPAYVAPSERAARLRTLLAWMRA